MSFLEVPFCVWTTSNLAVGVSLHSLGIVAVVIFVTRMGSGMAATTMCNPAMTPSMSTRHYRRRHNKRRGKNEGNDYALHGLTRTAVAIAFQIAPRAMMLPSGTSEYRCATRSARCIRTARWLM